MPERNLINELQNKVYERLEYYGIGKDETSEKYSLYTHVRKIISLHLQKDTGTGLIKGNHKMSEETYDKCLKYLDIILPREE